MRFPRDIFLSLLIAVPVPPANDADAEELWRGTISRHCLDCHDSDSQKGDLDLEPLLDAPVANHAADWERVLRQLEARQMPPIGKDRPDESGYESLTAALVTELDRAASEHSDPGRTDTLRRLTRTEYRNAIRDLLALEIDVSGLLPRDESSHGFDNVTVGDLSPALLERYLAAAQEISRLAVGSPLRQPGSRTIRIRPDVTQEEHVEGLPLGTRGGALISHVFPRDGDYEIQVHLTRDRNGMVEGVKGNHQLEFLLDGEPKATLTIRLPKNRKDHNTLDADLKARFRVSAGPRNLGVTFVKHPSSLEETLRQPYQAHFNFHRHPRISPAIYQVTVIGPDDAGAAGQTPSRERIFGRAATDEIEEDEEARARKILSNLARQAWRRPVAGKDLDRLLELFREGREIDGEGDFETGIERALSAILVSREFLFRVEKDPESISPGTPYPLGDLELASRLSFFLWSSLPDEELLATAERGELRRPAVLESQARRMLADPRSRSLVTNFADQWLYLRNLDAITPDGRLFPGFDDNLRQAFRRETQLLFESVLREDRNVLDLLRTRETFLNERLARHYGIPHIYGTRFRRVSLDAGTPRGGILRHGSILTVTSYATRTSPVIRGNWILENLLGTPPPPPPPNVPALEDNDVPASLPIRERLAVHREKAACASCHNLVDPIGFALEHYDAVGRWRTWDGENPVDATGALAGGSEFDGVEGLETALLERPERFVRTLTEKLMTYALGRGIEPTDAPAVRQVVRAAGENGYRFSDVVTGIVRSRPFTMRMSESVNE